MVDREIRDLLVFFCLTHHRFGSLNGEAIIQGLGKERLILS